MLFRSVFGGFIGLPQHLLGGLFSLAHVSFCFSLLYSCLLVVFLPGLFLYSCELILFRLLRGNNAALQGIDLDSCLVFLLLCSLLMAMELPLLLLAVGSRKHKLGLIDLDSTFHLVNMQA